MLLWCSQISRTPQCFGNCTLSQCVQQSKHIMSSCGVNYGLSAGMKSKPKETHSLSLSPPSLLPCNGVSPCKPIFYQRIGHQRFSNLNMDVRSIILSGEICYIGGCRSEWVVIGEIQYAKSIQSPEEWIISAR